ncbi:hypothetical protein [Streptomyces sp. NPDC005890]|uniref:hypothetical protein n=1 Tax=Streptomyces sp. NPDC005890 TaxID=3154568 RepID=UPI0033D4575B
MKQPGNSAARTFPALSEIADTHAPPAPPGGRAYRGWTRKILPLVVMLGVGAGAGVALSLIAQIGEQADYLRFTPDNTPENSGRWWANVAVAWIGAVAADLVVDKPLRLSPSYIEFKRAHLPTGGRGRLPLPPGLGLCCSLEKDCHDSCRGGTGTPGPMVLGPAPRAARGRSAAG